MRFSKFKTKAFFTGGIYVFVWRYQVATWLRDGFGAPVSPGLVVGSSFVPIYGLIVWWRLLTVLKTVQQQAGLPSVVSPGRAFWWSSLWFAAGPYLNRHLNTLDAVVKARTPAPVA